MAAASPNPVKHYTSGPIDPDLEAVLSNLIWRARRLEQLEDQLASPTNAYRNLAAQRTERADIYEEFRNVATRLNMAGDEPWRTLLLIAETAFRLYDNRKRQRPTLAHVLAAISAEGDLAERAARAARVERRLAEGAERDAVSRLGAARGAITYLEKCSG